MANTYLARAESYLTLLSYRIPKSTLTQPNFQKRFVYFLCGELVIVGVGGWGYVFFSTIFVNMPLEYQWILALICPLVKEFFAWLLLSITYKAVGGSCEFHRPKLATLHYIESKHALFLAIMVGSVANSLSTWIILGTDFVINIYQGLKIVYMLKSSEEVKHKEGKCCFQ